MTRPPRHLSENMEVLRVTPRVATTMLINGLLPPDDAADFKPANLSMEQLVKLLHNANEVRNRTISLPHVLKLSRDMTDGHWLWTGAPIQLDVDGFVRNGQHRLLAVVHSKTTQDFLVVRNLDPGAQLVIDVGRPRSVANQMQMTGISSAGMITAIANLLIRWRSGRVMQSQFTPSVMEVHELIQKEDELQDTLTMIYRVRKGSRRSPLSALGAVFIEGGHIDRKARDEFFEKLITGANLAVDDPILVLRNTMGRPSHSVRGRRNGQLYQIVHAWNLWRRNETARFIRVPSTLSSETFPKLR